MSVLFEQTRIDRKTNEVHNKTTTKQLKTPAVLSLWRRCQQTPAMASTLDLIMSFGPPGDAVVTLAPAQIYVAQFVHASG